MNKELEKIIKERNLHPISYKKIKSVYVVNCQGTEYAIKLNTNNYDVYKYLLSRDFSYFPINYNRVDDNYDISLYIKGTTPNKEQLINDYIKIIAILHNKTSYKRRIDLDEIKDKYEKLNNQIESLREYYFKINEIINHELFFSPSDYLLVRNISLIYHILDDEQILLTKVYNKIKDEKSIRVSLLHNNVDLSHLIVDNKNYLISWDYAYFDSPIYEIEKIYREYFQNISLIDLLTTYEKNNKLDNLEKAILLINLSIPMKIELTNNSYNDTKIINQEIKYLNKVYELLIRYKNDL